MPTRRREDSIPRAQRASAGGLTGSRGGAAPYTAYAIGADGTRKVIRARHLVVDLGGSEVEINLRAPPILSGQLRIAARGDARLVVGHGDAGSVYVAVKPFASPRSGNK